MPSIHIDDDVYEELQRRALAFVDTPNTVLRRALGLAPGSIVKEAPPPSRTGDLMNLLQKGDLRVGEVLHWKRRGGTHTATVTASGGLEVDDGTTHTSPSGAARHLAGCQVNGWRQWRKKDGTLLDDLR